MKKKRNIAVWIIGALVLVIAGVAFIVAETMKQQLEYDKWKDYEDCGI